MLRVLAAALAAVLAVACGGGAPPPAGPSPKPALTLAVMPPMTAAAAAPAVEAITRSTGVPVHVVTPAKYSDLRAGVAGGAIDIAWIDAVAYLAVGPSLGDVLASTPSQGALIVCNPAAGVPALHDGGDWSPLRGRTFAFGDPQSLPDSIWARYYLARNHVDPASDLKPATIQPAAAAVALAVYNNTANCGAMFSDARGLVVRQAPDVVAKTAVVFSAPEAVPGAPLLVRRGLARSQRAAVARAFPVAGDVPASSHDYDFLRRVITAVSPGLPAKVSQ